MTNFRQHTVLLTGATGGIGRALAQALSKVDTHVIATARSSTALKALAQDLPNPITNLPADLACDQGVNELLKALEPYKVSGIIHCAGVQHSQALTNPDPDHRHLMRAELQLNLLAPIRLTTALLPVLAKTPAPFICAITSSLALAPKADAPVYCATKAGLRSFLRALRYQCDIEFPHLLINEVLPALVDTAMTTGRGTDKDSPKTVATAILRGLARRQDETWIGKAKLLRHLHSLSPQLVARILK